METYRECLSDAFDLDSLVSILQGIEEGSLSVVVKETTSPSPFAGALLFSYAAQFIYDTDAPLAERRAQALTIDHAQLRELLGEAELRELLDPESIRADERRAQHLDGRFPIKHQDGLHDLLLSIGDLTLSELEARAAGPVDQWIEGLRQAGRAVQLSIGGQPRWVAVEDVARYRDAFAVRLPANLPEDLLTPVDNALTELVGRYARTHGPFRADAVAQRFQVGVDTVELALSVLERDGRVLKGDFLPGGSGTEWCDPERLRTIKRASLASLKKQIEPQSPAAYGRFLVDWHGISVGKTGPDAVLEVVHQLQGAALYASVLESAILPARITDYVPAMLDELTSAGEVVWRGLAPVGKNDGQIGLYLTEDYHRLAPAQVQVAGDLCDQIRTQLTERGALFFSELSARIETFTPDLIEALWAMVYAGELTNDTLAPLRSRRSGPESRLGSYRRPGRASRPGRRNIRSRRHSPPGTEGRWSLLEDPLTGANDTMRRTAQVQQMLVRYGLLTREAIQHEGLPGGFSSIYPILKGLEERGQIRRGWFVEGLGATQFALPGAVERLRVKKEDRGVQILSATDPANPYGAALPWPKGGGERPRRVAAGQVVLSNGDLLAWLSGGAECGVLTFGDRPEEVAPALASIVRSGARDALLITRVNGEPPKGSVLEKVGFRKSGKGYLLRRFDPGSGHS